MKRESQLISVAGLRCSCTFVAVSTPEERAQKLRRFLRILKPDAQLEGEGGETGNDERIFRMLLPPVRPLGA